MEQHSKIELLRHGVVESQIALSGTGTYYLHVGHYDHVSDRSLLYS